MKDEPSDTQAAEYTELLRSSEVPWKRLLGVQRVYAWNLRRLKPGFMLDVGCGIGRNLRAVRGNGIGVDHNPHSVAYARTLGFAAFTPDEFRASPYCKPGRFDSILVSHVLEHMIESDAEKLVDEYLPYLRSGGQLIVITPQESGFHGMPTHIRFTAFEEVERLYRRSGLKLQSRASFPLPRRFGPWFRYNEFVLSAVKP